MTDRSYRGPRMGTISLMALRAEGLTGDLRGWPMIRTAIRRSRLLRKRQALPARPVVLPGTPLHRAPRVIPSKLDRPS